MLTRDALVSKVIRRIDHRQLAKIQQRYVGHGYGKYFDVEHWVRVNVMRASRMRLHMGPPRRVLDLGAGFGYFLAVCRELEHDVLGIDDAEPIYQEASAAIGVPVLVAPIEAGKPLPVPPPYDVVTAHMICFNNHNTPGLWGVREWRHLLDQLIGATVDLELNIELDGTIFPSGVAELFRSYGATITGARVWFPRVRVPA